MILFLATYVYCQISNDLPSPVQLQRGKLFVEFVGLPGVLSFRLLLVRSTLILMKFAHNVDAHENCCSDACQDQIEEGYMHLR